MLTAAGNTFVCEQNTVLRHHWVHRRRQDGKCKQCGKVKQKSHLRFWRVSLDKHSSVFCCTTKDVFRHWCIGSEAFLFHTNFAPYVRMLFPLLQDCLTRNMYSKYMLLWEVVQRNIVLFVIKVHVSCRSSLLCIIHRVSKNVPPLAFYNFDTHELIF